jgi:AraC-like DNA-binding protein
VKSMNDAGQDANATQPEGVGQSEQRMATAYREELVRRIARATSVDGETEPLKGLHLARVSSTTGPAYGVAFPAFCVIAQGTKEIFLGEERYQYDPYHYLLSTIELPIVIQQIEASPEKPYLSMRLALDAALVASVMLEVGMPSHRTETASARAIDVSLLDDPLLEAAVRLVRLVEAPSAEARMLQPLITREIVFRLLAGEQGARLRHLAVLGGHTDRIARAIERLRHDFDKPLRIETLAREHGMSPSSFHEHFKGVTAMSPLQFQKHLRLQEARRLMLSEDMDAATAGYRVGYEDTSQFSKEYKRLFGEPPMRDVGRLREVAKSS